MAEMVFHKANTYLASQVSEEFRDIGILSGYRQPGSDFKQCLLSLFYLHNETLNVWTHLISFSFFVYYTIEISQKIDLLEHEALLCLLIGCCLFPLGSAAAHLFNNMCSVSRHVCFMLDYLAITVYAFGACIANKVYALPTVWRGGLFESYFLTAMFLSCVMTIIISCYTRFLPKTKTTKILRLGSFVYPYLSGMTPCIYRAFFCKMDCSCDAAAFYQEHFCTNLFTVIFYAGHIPEVVFPGYFDVFFHSHQIFHVVVILATYRHAQGIFIDALRNARLDVAAANTSVISPLLLLLLLAIINTSTVCYFAMKMKLLKNGTKKAF